MFKCLNPKMPLIMSSYVQKLFPDLNQETTVFGHPVPTVPPLFKYVPPFLYTTSSSFYIRSFLLSPLCSLSQAQFPPFLLAPF